MDLRRVRTIRSAIEVRAPLEVVWQVLTDFGAYPEWNPHLRQVRGKPRLGRRISIVSQPPGARRMRFRPLIVAWLPPHELRWRSTFVTPRLFSGEHGFRLEPLGDERVRFVQDETFRGLLVPLFSRFRLHATRRGFEQVNQALRERAELLAAELRVGRRD
ncbi:MAG TPA: SRPBCC domain-containing protein [Candidatus Limnocylindria bacterium]|nr:SRPBCC domain-containing protein [Candidatus Limnocylindria bacterium]